MEQNVQTQTSGNIDNKPVSNVETVRFLISIVIVNLLWFFMFSPLTAGLINFWLGMSISAVILLTVTSNFFPQWFSNVHISFVGIVFGLFLAVALWVVFWLGDRISAVILPFTIPQVDVIYTLKDGSNPWLIGLALLFLVGPAEEIYWRGYVQRTLSKRWNPNTGYIVMTLVYSLVHIWSFNFMLIMAAAVAGGFQGLVYRLFPKHLFALIVSHALWDVAVFLVFPI